MLLPSQGFESVTGASELTTFPASEDVLHWFLWRHVYGSIREIIWWRADPSRSLLCCVSHCLWNSADGEWAEPRGGDRPAIIPENCILPLLFGMLMMYVINVCAHTYWFGFVGDCKKLGQGKETTSFSDQAALSKYLEVVRRGWWVTRCEDSPCQPFTGQDKVTWAQTEEWACS